MKNDYVHALGFPALTPLYDLVSRVTLGGTRLGENVRRHAALESGSRVLDLGCGTGRMLLELARAPEAPRVTGLDGDAAVLARARAKLAAAAVPARLCRGLADRLPFGDASFDRVVSSLVFHHLAPATKRATAAELARVLTPGGRLVIADWGRPAGPLARLLFYPVQWLDGFATTQSNVEGLIPEALVAAGLRLEPALETWPTLFGTLWFYVATKVAR